MKQATGFAHKKALAGVVFDPTGRYMVSWAMDDGGMWWDLDKKIAKPLKEGLIYYAYKNGVFYVNDGKTAYRADTGEPAPAPPEQTMFWSQQTGTPIYQYDYKAKRKVFESDLIAIKGTDMWGHPDGWALVQMTINKKSELFRLEANKPARRLGRSKGEYGISAYGVMWLPGTDLLFGANSGVLYDANRGRILWDDKRYAGETATLSADGKTLFVADHFEIRSFSVPDGKPGKVIRVHKDFPAPYTVGWNIWPSPMEGIWAVSPYSNYPIIEQRKLYAFRNQPIALVSDQATTDVVVELLNKRIEADKIAQAAQREASRAALPKLINNAAIFWPKFAGANAKRARFTEIARTSFVLEPGASPWLETTQKRGQSLFVVCGDTSAGGEEENGLTGDVEEELGYIGKPGQWRPMIAGNLRFREYDTERTALPPGMRMWTTELTNKEGVNAVGMKYRFRLRVTQPHAYLVVQYAVEPK